MSLLTEENFSFSKLHLNAGAKLRSEVQLLPDLFFHSTGYDTVVNPHTNVSPANQVSGGIFDEQDPAEIAEGIHNQAPAANDDTGPPGSAATNDTRLPDSAATNQAPAAINDMRSPVPHSRTTTRSILPPARRTTRSSSPLIRGSPRRHAARLCWWGTTLVLPCPVDFLRQQLLMIQINCGRIH
jgi:hypothetical protein